MILRRPLCPSESSDSGTTPSRSAQSARLAVLLLASGFAAYAQVQTNVLVTRNDSSASGQYLVENLLNYNNVNTSRFGKVFSWPVDGQVYTQPLFVAGLYIPGSGRHNVLFIGTEHDSVYAFDADGRVSTPLWQVSFINPAAGITTVPNTDVNSQQIVPEMGITPTPVIDPNTNTIFFEVYTKEVSGSTTNYVHRLHALDATTGAERPNSPALIQPSYTLPSGTVVTFDGMLHKTRMGLIIVNGTVFIAYASHGDQGPYHGWVVGYNETTLAQVTQFSDTLTGTKSGIWQGGSPPVVDSSGNLYVMTGNGDFDGVYNFGESFLKLSSSPKLSLLDFFTPYNQEALTNGDVDVGSGGPLLLPDSVGSTTHPHLITGAGKEGTIYLVDRDNMGKYQTGSDSQIVQSIPDALDGQFSCNPTFFNGIVYWGASGDALKGYQISNGLFNTTPVTATTSTYFYPGAQTSLSANGTTNGILWFMENSGVQSELKQGPAILHAFKVSDLTDELYNSAMNVSRDGLDHYVKWAWPTIAQGRVYVGTNANVTAFGVLTPSCATDVSSQITVTRGAIKNVATGQYQQTVQLTNSGTTAIAGPLSYVTDSLPGGVTLIQGYRTTTCQNPTGSPYASVGVSGGSLQPGQSVKTTLGFYSSSASQITYTSRVLAGNAVR